MVFYRNKGNPLSITVILFTRVQAAVQSKVDYTPTKLHKTKRQQQVLTNCH